MLLDIEPVLAANCSFFPRFFGVVVVAGDELLSFFFLRGVVGVLPPLSPSNRFFFNFLTNVSGGEAIDGALVLVLVEVGRMAGGSSCEGEEGDEAFGADDLIRLETGGASVLLDRLAVVSSTSAPVSASDVLNISQQKG
jgi:hypothetical protein